MDKSQRKLTLLVSLYQNKIAKTTTIDRICYDDYNKDNNQKQFVFDGTGLRPCSIFFFMHKHKKKIVLETLFFTDYTLNLINVFKSLYGDYNRKATKK